MCESRKEQSDGIAIATKSIASSCPARRALPNGRWGKHVRKGDIFLTCSHFPSKLAFPKNAIFGCITRKEKPTDRSVLVVRVFPHRLFEA